jgi:hypothetical protein
VGFNLEGVHFETPEVGKGFKFSTYSVVNGVLGKETFHDCRPIETIVEEEGRAGKRWIVMTDEVEYILRQVEPM